MSLNSTPSANRVHIGIFGRRNVGKSSLINALTNQNLAIVSDIKGTTTDPVLKSMEILPIGPVVLIDTAGIDDDSELGKQRIEKSLKILGKTDLALLVTEYGVELSAEEQSLIEKFEASKIPYIHIVNKSECDESAMSKQETAGKIYISCNKKQNIEYLKQQIAIKAKPLEQTKPIVNDLLDAHSTVVLVTPIDESAPKGRLILPQQQVTRELLDNEHRVIIVQPSQLPDTLSMLKSPPSLIITDSQVFGKVSELTPSDILLTSFSILFARYKGILEPCMEGISTVGRLSNHAHILISEGCTHHKQCGDIGSVKIPAWLEEFTQKSFEYTFSSGNDFPDELSPFSLVVHCGGCMLGEREVLRRIQQAQSQNVPITNYGMLISLVHGTLQRSLLPFTKRL